MIQIILFIILTVSAWVQVPVRVEVTAPDGLTLVGDFYAASSEGEASPAVLLLHGQTEDRHAWVNLIPALLDGGYHVLTVDQRAHGETGGDRVMLTMIDDVGVWLAWLREQPEVDASRIATIGSSMGTVPALAGCAANAECVTAIIISPGDFPTLDEAMFQTFEERSLLIIVGRRDSVYYDARKLFDRAVGEAAMHVYRSGAHGMAFFSSRSPYKTRVTDLILSWLDEHGEG
jgi:pimeloyl-ACP methyl ester carboxylesterase